MDPSARQAFEVEAVVTRLTAKVTSIAAHDHLLYVGTSDGQIQMFRDKGGEYRLVDSVTLVKKRSVDQLAAIPDLDRLMALCDGFITVHNLKSLEKLSSTIAEKGVSMFCLDQKGPPLYRMCAVRRKKVLLYEYSRGRFAFVRMFGLPDEPQSVAWYGGNLFVAYKREYNVIDNAGDVETIRVDIDSRTIPLIKFMPNKELLLAGPVAGSDHFGIYVELTGRPANRSPVNWSRPPSAVAYCFPYIVSLMPKTPYLEVHSWQDPAQALVQRIPVEKGASCLCDSIFGTDQEAKGRNPVFFALPGKVMRLKPIAFDRQVAFLVRNLKMEEAFTLLDSTTEESRKPSKLSRFHLDAGRVLFLDLQFEEAVTHLSNSLLDPRELIAMYPELQPPNFSYRSRYFNSGLLNAIIDGRKGPGDGATFEADAPDGDTGVPFPTVLSAEAAGGASGAGSGAGAGAIMSSMEAPTSGGDSGSGTASAVVPAFSLVVRGVLSGKSQSFEGVAVEAVVKDSLRFLVHFLQDRRDRYKRRTDVSLTAGERQLHEALDTALLKAYAFRRKGTQLDQFVQGPNAVNLDDAREFLLQHRLFHVLALLYKGRGMAREALTMWMQMGSGAEQYAERNHNGVPETIEYLASLDDHELVWTFSPWVLRADHAAAMRIFVQPTRSVPLQPDRVLEHLQSFADLPVTDLCQQYLEFLINTQGNTEKRYHTQLAEEYLSTVLALRREVPEEAAGGTHRVRPEPGSEPGKLGLMRGKLVRLLVVSDRYDVRVLIAATAGTTLYEERVVLHSKVGEHRAALRLIVYELSNTSEAEAYCEEQHHKGIPEGVDDPFLVLLDIYFSDESRRADFTKAALGLLRLHGKSMDPVAVLRRLPATLSVLQLKDYLSQVIPHTAHKVRNGQVVRNLYKREQLRINCELIKEHKRNVLITVDSFCGVCRRRLGDTLFAVYPNNTVVHMHCAQDSMDFDPVTGTKFSKRQQI